MSRTDAFLDESRSASQTPTPPGSLSDLVDERTRDLIARRRLGKGHRRGWLIRRALVSADLVGLLLAFLIAQAVTNDPSSAGANRVSTEVEVIAFLFTLPAWILLADLYALYSRDEEHANHTAVDEAVGVFTMLSVGTFGLLALSYATGLADPFIPKVLVYWASAVVLVTAARALARRACRRTTTYLQNTIIIGAGEVGQLIGSKILRHPEYGINLLGFLDMEPRARRNDIGDLMVLGGVERLTQIVDALDVERVVVAFAGEGQERPFDDLRRLRNKNVQIDVVPRFFDIVGPGADFHAIEGFPLVGLAPARLPLSSLMLKRAVDVIGSALSLLILSPVFVYVAIRIKLDSPGPVLFSQRRPGRGGTLITVMKFRTMREHPGPAEKPFGDGRLEAEFKLNYKLREDPRVTNYGKTLRRNSLDELPQLINVLRGDMSLVGPRPMLVEERDARPELEELLVVKPGITGYWQINGRSDVDYDDRVRLEASYVSSWSLGLDLTILWKTIRVLAGRHGAY